MFFNFFKKKSVDEEMELKIISFEKKLSLKSEELENLLKEKKKIEVELTEEKISQKINQKQTEIIEKNLRDLKKENEYLKEKTENKEIFSQFKIKYKISVERFYHSSKYEEVVKELKGLNIQYIDSLKIEDFDYINRKIKNYEDAKKLFLSYKKGNEEFEMKLISVKGERINRVYSRFRKFNGYLAENFLEFMDDIEHVDFYELLDDSFKEEHIKELIEKKENYFEEFLIKKTNEV
ncbi:MAG: hypothetical protein ACRC6K_05375 [Fusobacteriaceae bacterium]